MRQLFLDRGMTVVKEVCKPLLDDHMVLVEVHYSFVSSGTELATIAQTKNNTIFKSVPEKVKKIMMSLASKGAQETSRMIKSQIKGEFQSLGYSCSGVVIAVGKKVKRIKTNDWVACAGAGYAHHADIVTVPENLVVRINNKKYVREASITTLGAIALQGMRRAELQIGEFVCVLGLGLIGQLTVQLAKQAGCIVIGIDLIKERLDLAKQLGADFVYDGVDEEIQREVLYLTNHQGVDATLITATSDSDAIVQQSIEITRKKGKVVIVGDVGLNLKRNPLYSKEIDMLISCSYGPGRYDVEYEQHGKDYPYGYVRWTENRNMKTFVQLVEQKKVLIEPLIGKEVTLDEINKGYEAIISKKSIGVLLNYEGEKKSKTVDCSKKSIESYLFKPAKKDNIRVGVVGAGGFAKDMLMPAIEKMKGVNLSAVVDANTSRALTVSRLYGMENRFVNQSDMLQNNLVDAVVIASSHKYHCAQALEALKKGKAVFLEKPMVTDEVQLELLTEVLKKQKNVPFCVDYNRGFSPFIQKIKHALKKRNSPLMINYRMNAGFIPKEHWVQTDIGAGRLIGEACHVFDLFYDLTQSQPTAVSVDSMLIGQESIFPTDNFVATISFEDGSVCSLHYTALGHEKAGKERIEIFFDSKTIVVKDYKELIGYGMPYGFNTSLRYPDKGHNALLKEFFYQLTQEKFVPPIPLSRLEDVAKMTLLIDKLACDGGGSQVVNNK